MNVNVRALDADLDANWAVVAEAIQTVLRREGYPKPYEALKDLTRVPGGITEGAIKEFVGRLNVSARVKDELLRITPHTFTGVAFVAAAPSSEAGIVAKVKAALGFGK